MKHTNTHHGAQSQKVEDLMSREPTTVDQNATLHTAAHLMWTQDFACLPVVDGEERLIGFLTDRDISMCCYTQGRALHELPVHLAMQRDVIRARVGDDREHVEALMGARHLHRLPVVDGEGRVVGIVSRSDLRGRGASGRTGLSVHDAAIAAPAPLTQSQRSDAPRLRT